MLQPSLPITTNDGTGQDIPTASGDDSSLLQPEFFRLPTHSMQSTSPKSQTMLLEIQLRSKLSASPPVPSSIPNSSTHCACARNPFQWLEVCFFLRPQHHHRIGCRAICCGKASRTIRKMRNEEARRQK